MYTADLITLGYDGDTTNMTDRRWPCTKEGGSNAKEKTACISLSGFETSSYRTRITIGVIVCDESQRILFHEPEDFVSLEQTRIRSPTCALPDANVT